MLVEEMKNKKKERIQAQEAEIERFSKMSEKEREYNLKKMQEEMQNKKMKAMEETLKKQ